MTNREWLETLTNEDLAKWMTEQASEIVGWETIIVEGNSIEIAKFDYLCPRLAEIKGLYSSAESGLEKWLREEHYDK